MNKQFLPPAQIIEARKTLTKFTFFNVISFVLLSGNILTLYVLRLGGGSLLVGILSSISYCSYAAIFIGRHLAPKLGMVKLMGRYWLIRYIMMVPIIIAPLFLLQNMRVVAYVIIVFSVLGFNIARGIGITAYNPILGEITTIKDRGGFLARLQGVNHSVTLILGIVMAAFLGAESKLLTYSLFIICGIIFGFFATVIFKKLPEPISCSNNLPTNVLIGFKNAMKHSAFNKFTTVHFLVSFATFMITPFLIVYVKVIYHQPDNYIVYYTVFGSLGGIIMALLSGFLIDRLGSKPLYFIYVATSVRL
jgi:MFS family permease